MTDEKKAIEEALQAAAMELKAKGAAADPEAEAPAEPETLPETEPAEPVAEEAETPAEEQQPEPPKKEQKKTAANALKEIAKSDKERGNHYFRYTDQKWGKAQNYDLCINSALMSIDKIVKMIVRVAQIEEEK